MKRKRKILRFTAEKVLSEFEEEEKPKIAEEKERGRFLAMISLASELGFSIALPIAGGALIGRFLDEQFQISPRMTLSLIFFGLLIGAANIFFIIKESKQK